MRFYHEIKDLVRPHLQLILQDPFQQFSKDIVYFFSCEHGTGWKPYNIYEEHYPVTWKAAPRFYTPHPFSPLSNEVRRVMKITMEPTEPHYPEFYADLVSECGENKLLEFVTHGYDIIEKYFEAQSKEVDKRDVFNPFFLVQHLARMGVFFHQMGTPDAAHMATTLISLFLILEQKVLGTDNVFELLHQYCVRFLAKDKEVRNRPKE